VFCAWTLMYVTACGIHSIGHNYRYNRQQITLNPYSVSYNSLILLMAEVHGNRTHLPALNRYAGFEDQEAHQDPGTSVEDNLLCTRKIVNAQVED
jgi:hypothetical protein